MKMAEFLALKDSKKVEVMEKFQPDDDVPVDWPKITEDAGVCSQCGGKADVGDYCFGCHKLICENCVEQEPHLSKCWNKALGG